MRTHDLTRRGRDLAAAFVLVAALGGCSAATTPTDSPVASGGAGAAAASRGASASAPAAASSAISGGAGAVTRVASGAIKACDLLTAAQIEIAIGTPVVEPVDYGEIECRWRVQPLAAFEGSEDPWIDVQFFENDLPMLAVEAAPATNGVVAIDGLGDRAFRTNDFRHLWVQHGSDVFVVRSRLRAITDESEASRDAAEAIEVLMARLVLDQL